MLLFELEEYELCLLAVDSFRHYLKSVQSLPPRSIEAHQAFIQNIKRLVTLYTKARNKERREQLIALRQSIADLEYNTLNIRSWLLEQVDRIIG